MSESVLNRQNQF